MLSEFLFGQGPASGSRRSFHSCDRHPEGGRDGHAHAGGPINSIDQNRRRDSGQPRSGEDGAAAGSVDGHSLIHLTYVSASRIPSDNVCAELDSILTCSDERNRRDEITGALLFTGTRFVQTLEGTASAVDALMVSIARDRRHAALAVIDRHPVARRIFSGWSLTYKGPSLFVAKVVARGVAGFHLGVPNDVERLLRLMVEFGGAAPLRPGP